MSLLKIRGVFSAAATPLKADLSPDTNAYIAHCRALLDNGCDGLAILGTTGEANAFSVAERKALLDSLVEAGISPERLLPGTGVTALPETIELTKHALHHGVAAVVMLPPFYYKDVSEKGVIDAYTKIIETIADPSLKVILYHIPQMTQVPITLSIVEELCRRFPDTIVGIKDSSGDIENMKSLVERFPQLSVLPGADPLMLPMLKFGGAGCITATSNLVSSELAYVFAHYADPAKASLVDEAQARIVAMRNAISIHPQLASLKAVLAHRTNNPNWSLLRPPLVALNADQTAEVLNKAQGV